MVLVEGQLQATCKAHLNDHIRVLVGHKPAGDLGSSF